jgi:uncharacterized membrane-anchored protein YitT (DUF2179 family)
MKPLPKWLGLVFSLATIIQGAERAAVVAWIAGFTSAELAATIANILIGVSAAVVYFAHSGGGSGGTDAPPSITSNLTTR